VRNELKNLAATKVKFRNKSQVSQSLNGVKTVMTSSVRCAAINARTSARVLLQVITPFWVRCRAMLPFNFCRCTCVCCLSLFAAVFPANAPLCLLLTLAKQLHDKQSTLNPNHSNTAPAPAAAATSPYLQQCFLLLRRCACC
jgi:hypothetical protein